VKGKDETRQQLQNKISALRVSLGKAREEMAHHKAYHMSVVKWLSRENPELLRKLILALAVEGL